MGFVQQSLHDGVRELIAQAVEAEWNTFLIACSNQTDTIVVWLPYRQSIWNVHAGISGQSERCTIA